MSGFPSWILYALSASFLFAIGLTFLGKVVSQAGMSALFYTQVGVFISSVCFFVGKGFKNWRDKGTFWVDLNLKKDGKVCIRNVVGVVAYAVSHLACHQLAYLSIWAAYQA